MYFSKRLLKVASITLITILCVFAYLTYFDSKGDKSKHAETAALIGGKFKLFDQDGKSVSDKNLLGKKTLVLFGFSKCPHICPNQLSMLELSLEKYPNLQAFFITLDPKNDDVDTLKEFHEKFHPRIKMLTGDLYVIDKLASDYKVFVSRDDDPEKFNHSSIMYLMGKNGQYVAHFTPKNEDELLKDLQDFV